MWGGGSSGRVRGVGCPIMKGRGDGRDTELDLSGYAS